MIGLDPLPAGPKGRITQGVVNSHAIGWPGPASQKASLALAKYIVVDMFAKAVQGESPEAAVAWAENELKQVYGA